MHRTRLWRPVGIAETVECFPPYHRWAVCPMARKVAFCSLASLLSMRWTEALAKWTGGTEIFAG
jgi:hypothetical protein